MAKTPNNIDNENLFIIILFLTAVRHALFIRVLTRKWKYLFFEFLNFPIESGLIFEEKNTNFMQRWGTYFSNQFAIINFLYFFQI